MVKVVRVFLALFAILWYTTSPTGSTVPFRLESFQVVKTDIPSYYKPLEFNTVKYTPEDAKCLAKNIYFEAGVESTAGKLAVANVTINRAIHVNYPNTICGVVREGIHYYNAKRDEYFPVRNRCQFSWYCDGLGDNPREGRTWESAQELAKKVLVNYHDKALIDITDGAMYYHANWMETYPSWSKKKKIMTSIDRHIFYGSNKL
ncbi:MAG: cell wall hydrolase [Thaumarchaeota archaeon]|nr:cell wall hydrolase [Nitrososphaerota archaeon]